MSARTDPQTALLQDWRYKAGIEEGHRQAAAALASLREDARETETLREALERIADPEAEWQRYKDSCKQGQYGRCALPHEIARAALAGSPEQAT